jgi:hypothetical protein
MATSQIKRMNEANGRKVHVVGVANRPQWSPVFENNPRVVPRYQRGSQALINGAGARP